MRQKLFLVLVMIPALSAGLFGGTEVVGSKPPPSPTEKEIAAIEDGDEKLSASWLNFEIGSETLSSYVDQNGITLSRHAVTQSYLRITAGDNTLVPGLYGEVWHSADWKSSRLTSNYDGQSFGNELDGTVGWAGPIANYVDIDVGVRYMDVVKFADSHGDILQPFAEVSKTWEFGDDPQDRPPCNRGLPRSLRPFVRCEISLPVNGNEGGASSGNSLFAGLEYSAGITPDVTVIQTATLVTDDGIYGFNPAVLGDYQVRVEWETNDIITLHALFRVVGPFAQSGGDGSLRETEAVFGGGISAAF